MRFFLFYFIVLFELTGCIYYGDIHENASPLMSTSLSPEKLTNNWWDKFHDAELSKLITLSLRDSPNMAIVAARLRRAKHLAEGAITPLFPSIDFSGFVQRQKYPVHGLIPPPFNGRTYNIGEIGLNLNYDLDFWGKYRQVLAEKLSEKQAAEADMLEARLIISAAVANTYFQLLNNIAQIKLAKENIQLSQQIFKIVEDRAKHGIESDIPVKSALSNRMEAALSLLQFKQAESLIRNQLAVWLGKNPFTTEITMQQFNYRQHDVALPPSLTANVLAHRPDIAAAKFRAEAAAHKIKAAKAGFFPNINLNALFSYQTIGLGYLFNVGNQNNAIAAAVDLPIFDAGLRRANLKVNYAEYDLAVNQYNQTILTALQEAADQLAILALLDEQLRIQKDALNAISYNDKLVKMRYRHGIIEYAQVLEIKQLLLKEKAEQLSLQTRYLQTVVASIKALGGSDILV